MSPEQLRTTFGSFADPATEVAVSVVGPHTRVRLTRDGVEHDYMIHTTTNQVEARHDDSKRFASVESLLASSAFADLRSFAATQQKILRKIGEQSHLETAIALNGALVSRDHVLQELSLPIEDRVRLLVIDGPAGIGKTRFIERLVFQRAHEYCVGGVAPPVLHVESKGHRLSSLPSVIAQVTQDCRAKFTYHQVPVLVRSGLLLVAIDGFDELVDADGYKDSWSALSEFLRELNGHGTVLLAARDTFFDAQAFTSRLHGWKQTHSVAFAHIEPAKPEDARRWLKERNWTDEDLGHLDDIGAFADESFFLRPYFLGELAAAGGWDAVKELTPRGFVVDRFIDREAHKLVSRLMIADLMNVRQALGRMFEEIALDMKDRESDSVDLDFVRLVCADSFAGIVDVADLPKLEHKVASFAFLDPGSDGRLRRFPHEEIFHHFLAGALVRYIAHDGAVSMALRRGVLGQDFLEVFAEVFERRDEATSRAFFDNLKKAVALEGLSDRLQANGSALLLSALDKLTRVSSVELAELHADEATLANATPRAILRRVEVGRLDVRGADLTHVEFRECHVFALVADEMVRFGGHRPTVDVLTVITGGRTKTLRGAEDVYAWLASRSSGQVLLGPSLSASGSMSVNRPPLVEYFERVCRKATRQFYLREGDEEVGGGMMLDPLWIEVESILANFGRIKRDKKQMHGPPADLIRIVNPGSLLSPSPGDAEARKIWDAIQERAKELLAVKA